MTIPPAPRPDGLPSDSSPAARPGRPAGLLLALEGLVLVVFAGVLVRDVVAGDAGGTAQGLTEAVLVLVFAAGALWMAYGLDRSEGWARTPALLWHLFLLPIGFSLVGADRTVLGVGVLVLAAAGVVLAWRASARTFEEDDDPADPAGPV